ncbi:biotin-dependent carboxyltransferase family protein [Halarsenatibacter silvermanii]|uniref:5-oxoprolinase subunit C family protein n=1 Tax=Halarsenatibacter silvermanii TaxID=321763 RepID=UPI001356688D|nr:biotin-dependent carboxyltransferase family protein [Halarsenatibacter silvermanii]
MGKIKIIEPGPLTTVQDLGRPGFQRYGMPQAGAMDSFACRTASRLVGNEDNSAVLEFTMKGPTIEFLQPTALAVTGPNFKPHLNGCLIPQWRSIYAGSKTVLSFPSNPSGAGGRGYIAFKGGIDVPRIMGSRSTYIKGGIGGFKGRPLEEEDVLIVKEKAQKSDFSDAYLPAANRPDYDTEITARVIMGPQDKNFSSSGIENFLGGNFTVTAQADRMGYRLQGPSIEHRRKDSADIISDGIPPGAVQVPGHQNPIIMMADRQTTGGYPKIATVITSDQDRIAQLKPGNIINFKRIKVDRADELLQKREKRLEKIQRSNLKLISDNFYRIKVEGHDFNARVEEIEA